MHVVRTYRQCAKTPQYSGATNALPNTHSTGCTHCKGSTGNCLEAIPRSRSSMSSCAEASIVVGHCCRTPQLSLWRSPTAAKKKNTCSRARTKEMLSRTSTKATRCKRCRLPFAAFLLYFYFAFLFRLFRSAIGSFQMQQEFVHSCSFRRFFFFFASVASKFEELCVL